MVLSTSQGMPASFQRPSVPGAWDPSFKQLMRRYLYQCYVRWTNRWSRMAWVVGVLLLVIQTCGCANRRPTPLLVQPGRTGMPSEDGGPGFDLKVVTYNIWGLPSWMTRAQAGRYPRINRELVRLDPDIILLQEVWTAKGRKAAPANGRWSIARSRRQLTLFQRNGLVTLSKYPIIGGEFYPFSKGAFPDSLVNKGVLKVTVQLQDGSVVNVWNTHLQQGGPPEVHLCQVRELASWVQAAEDGQIADLVGGDFNCTPGSPAYQELEGLLGPSVHEVSGLEPLITCDQLSPEPGAGVTLDYVFIRARAPLQNLQAVQRVVFASANPKERLSDHLGLEAVLSIEPAISLVKVARFSRQEDHTAGAESPRLSFGGGE